MTAQTQQTELLPCPFCGADAITVGPWEIGTSDIFETCIECEYCAFHVSGSSAIKSAALSEVVAKWNRRAPAVPQKRTPLTDEQIDALWGGENVSVPQRVNRRGISRAIERAHGITQEKQG